MENLIPDFDYQPGALSDSSANLNQILWLGVSARTFQLSYLKSFRKSSFILLSQRLDLDRFPPRVQLAEVLFPVSRLEVITRSAQPKSLRLVVAYLG